MRRAALIVLGVAACLLLATFAAQILAKPTYRVEGQLYMAQQVERILNQGAQRTFWSIRDEAATHSEHLRSQGVLINALESIPKTSWPKSLQAEQSTVSAANRLTGMLRVDHLSPSPLLRVSLEAREREGLAPTVNAVMSSLLEVLQEEREKDSQNRLSFLTEERKTVEEEIGVLQERKQEVASRLLLHNYDRKPENPYYEFLVYTQQQYQIAYDDSLRKKAELEKARQDKERIGDRLTASSPGAVNAKLALTEAENAYEASKVVVEDLEKKLESVREQVAQTSADMREGMEINDAVVHLRNRLLRIEDRIRDIHLEVKEPLHISVRQMSLPPTHASGTNMKKLLAGFFVAPVAVFLGCLLAFELIDGTLRNRKELAHALGATPAAEIPMRLTNRGKAGKHSSAVVGAQGQLAIQQLALKFYREQEKNHAKVFLLTGSNGRSGSQCLSYHLAKAVSQYSDSILVLRFPRLAKGQPGSQEETVSGGEEYLETLLERVSGSFGLVYEKVDDHSPVFQDRPLLNNLLARARRTCNAIIIDAPSINDSELAMFLASRSDVVTVVARSYATSYRETRSAIETVVASGAPALTAVLTTGALYDPFISLLNNVLKRGASSLSGRVQRIMTHLRNAKRYAKLRISG